MGSIGEIAVLCHTVLQSTVKALLVIPRHGALDGHVVSPIAQGYDLNFRVGRGRAACVCVCV